MGKFHLGDRRHWKRVKDWDSGRDELRDHWKATNGSFAEAINWVQDAQVDFHREQRSTALFCDTINRQRPEKRCAVRPFLPLSHHKSEIRPEMGSNWGSKEDRLLPNDESNIKNILNKVIFKMLHTWVSLTIAHLPNLKAANDLQRFRHQRAALLAAFLHENEHQVRNLFGQAQLTR